MSKPQVIVTADKNGKVTVETSGVQGPQCESLSAAIEVAIGAPGVSQKKAEYFQQPNVLQPQAAKQGN